MLDELSDSLAKIAAPAPRKIFLPPLPGMETQPLPIPEVVLESFDPQAYLAGSTEASMPSLEEVSGEEEGLEGSYAGNNENASESIVESFGELSTDFFTVPTQDVSEFGETSDATPPIEDVSSQVIVEDFGIPSDLFNVPVVDNSQTLNDVTTDPSTPLDDTYLIGEETTSSTVQSNEPNLDGFFASPSSPTATTTSYSQDMYASDPTSQIFTSIPVEETITTDINNNEENAVSSLAEDILPSYAETQEIPTFTPPPAFAASVSSPIEEPQTPAPELLGFDPSKYLSGGKSSAAPSMGISAADLPSAQETITPAPTTLQNESSMEEYSTEDNTNIFTTDVNSLEEIANPEAAPSFDNDDTHEENNGNDTMQVLRELATLKDLF